MASANDERPTRARQLIATVVVILVVLAVWKLIDYRTQPPPPPHAIDAPARN